MRTVLAAALLAVASSAALAGEEPMTLTIDRNAVACPSFMGFGVEWDPGFWHEWNVKSGVTEADWDLVVKRIAWMKIPVVRMMMQVKWCRDGQGKYDWDRAEMKNVYRYLDVCQKQGLTVILTDWGCEPGWLKVPDIADVGDPKYATAIGTYMDYLLNQKGYTCTPRTRPPPTRTASPSRSRKRPALSGRASK